MTSSMRVILVDDERRFTNFAFCSPAEIGQFATEVNDGKCFPRRIQKKWALINNRVVFNVIYPFVNLDETLQIGQLALNAEQLESINHRAGDVVRVQRFVAPPAGFNLAELRVEVEILDGGSIALKRISASSIEKKFVKAFHKQRHLITGAETYKSVLREGLNLDNLEEDLMAQGIAGMAPLIRNILEKAFISRVISLAEAKRLKLQPVRGMVLYGPTGSGKTLIALGICKLLNAKEPKIVRGAEILRSFVGETEDVLTSVFTPAIMDEKKYGKEQKHNFTLKASQFRVVLSHAIIFYLGARSDLHVIIFDEIDSIASRRGEGMGQKYADRVVNQLLSLIDGVQKLRNIFVIGTTNRLEMLDEALIREGRLELLIKVDYPDEQGRLRILELHSSTFRVDPDVDLHIIAHRAQRCSGATIGSLVNTAYTYAVSDLGLTNSKTARVNATVKMTHFLRALQDISLSLQEKESLRPIHTLALPQSVSIPDGQLDCAQRIPQEKNNEDYKELKLRFEKFEMEFEALKIANDFGSRAGPSGHGDARDATPPDL
ncbi:hypothetical protein RJ639_020300 [Escallonia herrerae]|uniref:Vesicle-fusing ATPase n=1 Tax=Escallonia herrerae TaxID=1293975 RepID=A0AA89AH91_9ASTE|nr:hypothetical protein RJ639_020300 [Escallonia herrerae]